MWMLILMSILVLSILRITRCSVFASEIVGSTETVKIYDSQDRQIGICPKGYVFNADKQGSKWKVKFGDGEGFISNQYTLVGEELDDWIRENNQFSDRYVLVKNDSYVKSLLHNQVINKVNAGEYFKLLDDIGDYYYVYLDGQRVALGKADCEINYRVHLENWDDATFPEFGDYGSDLEQQICEYALQFVGNPYVWGGTDPHTGADCSGFVKYVYAHFGYSLPRCSFQQCNVGKEVDLSQLRPGDLIFYYRGNRIGHVTMYIGGGKVVQAMGRAYGIVVTDFDYSKPAFARRIL